MADDPSAFDELLKWIQDHPYQTIFYVVHGDIFRLPWVATVPFFAAVGLSAEGPISGRFHYTSFQRNLGVDIVKLLPLQPS
jgi:hypothetical protein